GGDAGLSADLSGRHPVSAALAALAAACFGASGFGVFDFVGAHDFNCQLARADLPAHWFCPRRLRILTLALSDGVCPPVHLLLAGHQPHLFFPRDSFCTGTRDRASEARGEPGGSPASEFTATTRAAFFV